MKKKILAISLIISFITIYSSYIPVNGATHSHTINCYPEGTVKHTCSSSCGTSNKTCTNGCARHTHSTSKCSYTSH